jgi:hypothetical protein
MPMPANTTRPRITSNGRTRRRVSHGSVNAVKSDKVAKPASAIDTFASFTAPNKHSQCSPMITPTPSSCPIFARPGHNLPSRANAATANAPRNANRHRHVTNTGALTEARRPRIVVAAKITTSKWSWSRVGMAVRSG